MSRPLRLILLAGSLLLGLIAAALLTVSGGGAGPVLRTRSGPREPGTDAVGTDAVGTDAVGTDAVGTDAVEVSLSPVGTVSLTRVPRRIVVLDVNYEDMLTAMGREESLVARGPSGGRQVFNGFYEQLPKLERRFDPTRLKSLYGAIQGDFDKEFLYALKGDIHHIDPVRLVYRHGWKPEDVREIARNVGPFFANRYSRENSHPGPPGYEFYSVAELAAKVGELYRADAVMAGLRRMEERLRRRIAAKLPPENERPTVGLIHFGRDGRVLPHGLAKGFGSAHLRAVGARDAFAARPDVVFPDHGHYTWLDIEGLLAFDPDVLIVPYAIYAEMRWSLDELQEFVRRDPLGRRLEAARSGRIYPGGTPMQGPIFLLFQIEMAAKQLYPERFGAFRADHAYPESERLFDRRALAELLTDSREGS